MRQIPRELRQREKETERRMESKKERDWEGDRKKERDREGDRKKERKKERDREGDKKKERKIIARSGSIDRLILSGTHHRSSRINEWMEECAWGATNVGWESTACSDTPATGRLQGWGTEIAPHPILAHHPILAPYPNVAPHLNLWRPTYFSVWGVAPEIEVGG